MSKFLRLKGVAAAAVVTAGLLSSGSANADAYAVSELQIQDLSISLSGLGSKLNSFEFSLTNTASLNGTSSPNQSAQCGTFIGPCGAAPVLDASLASVPAGVTGENNYSFLGPIGNYTRADSIINSAQLVTGASTSTQQIAEGNVTTGFGQAAAVVGSSTNLTFSVTVGEDGSLTLFFNADPDQLASLTSLGNARSVLSASFTLTQDSTGDSVNWSPNGTSLVNECTSTIAGAVCTENFDSQDLNDVVNVGTAGTSDANSYDPALLLTSFGITITGLTAGSYTLGLGATTSIAIASTAVPEPASLALVGLALSGMGLSASRRRQRK